jgi:hypothetical protein
MTNFHAFDRDTDYLPPPSIVNTPAVARGAEVINGLDLSVLIRSYRGAGSASYHVALLLGYATGVFSSRKAGARDL